MLAKGAAAAGETANICMPRGQILVKGAKTTLKGQLLVQKGYLLRIEVRVRVKVRVNAVHLCTELFWHTNPSPTASWKLKKLQTLDFLQNDRNTLEL